MSQGSHPAGPRRWRALALLGTAFFMVILEDEQHEHTVIVTAPAGS